MGKIIIDLPLNINRHYRLSDVEAASSLVRDLETSAMRVKRKSDTEAAEDLADIRAAKRARKGDLVAWETAKAFLDTLD